MCATNGYATACVMQPAHTTACVVHREKATACALQRRTSALSFTRLRDFPAAFFMLRVRYGNKYNQLPMGRVLASHAFFVTTKNICHATSCQHHPPRPFTRHATPRQHQLPYPFPFSHRRTAKLHHAPRHHQPQLPHLFPHAARHVPPAPVPARSPRAERATAPVPVPDVPRSRTVKPLFRRTISPSTPRARSYLCNRVNSTIMSPCPMRVSM